MKRELTDKEEREEEFNIFERIIIYLMAIILTPTLLIVCLILLSLALECLTGVDIIREHIHPLFK